MCYRAVSCSLAQLRALFITHPNSLSLFYPKAHAFFHNRGRRHDNNHNGTADNNAERLHAWRLLQPDERQVHLRLLLDGQALRDTSVSGISLLRVHLRILKLSQRRHAGERHVQLHGELRGHVL